MDAAVLTRPRRRGLGDARGRRAQAEIDSLGRPTSGPDTLTPTEMRVAELAAGGLSNREIADRVFITVKTVEANLTRSYRKLGVHSRAALANLLRSRAPTEPDDSPAGARRQAIRRADRSSAADGGR